MEENMKRKKDKKKERKIGNVKAKSADDFKGNDRKTAKKEI